MCSGLVGRAPTLKADLPREERFESCLEYRFTYGEPDARLLMRRCQHVMPGSAQVQYWNSCAEWLQSIQKAQLGNMQYWTSSNQFFYAQLDVKMLLVELNLGLDSYSC